MSIDDKYRSFLLGAADEETEIVIEEEILDGRINIDHVCQIEEELIDEHLFGRLSPEEERLFRSRFLSTPGLVGKVKFAIALQRYSARKIPGVERRGLFAKLRELASIPSVLPWAGTVSCVLVVTLWLGDLNLRLNHELVLARHENNERRQVIDSLIEEQKRRVGQPNAWNDSVESGRTAISKFDQASVQTEIRLSPGVSRGLATIQVLHLHRQTRTVSIVLELPFGPVNTLREELLSSEDKIVWSQQFSNAHGMSNHGTTTIVLPSGFLVTGDYRLQAEGDANAKREGGGATATYVFRVRNE